MSGWTDRIDYPDIGVGWVRMSKARDVSTRGVNSKQIDHMYIAPSGQKFRSIKQAMEFINDPVAQEAIQRAASAGAAKAATKTAAKPKKPPAAKKPRSAAAIAKAEAAREAKAAKMHALNAVPDHAVCYTCGSGEDAAGNEILLCDGAGCHAAYHLSCLERPLFSIPEGDWLCPACEPPAPPPAKLTSPACASKTLQPERQSVDGVDLMRWARVTSVRRRMRGMPPHTRALTDSSSPRAPATAAAPPACRATRLPRHPPAAPPTCR